MDGHGGCLSPPRPFAHSADGVAVRLSAKGQSGRLVVKWVSAMSSVEADC